MEEHQIMWNINAYKEYKVRDRILRRGDLYTTGETWSGTNEVKIYKLVGVIVMDIEWEEEGKRIILIGQDSMGMLMTHNYLPGNPLFEKSFKWVNK